MSKPYHNQAHLIEPSASFDFRPSVREALELPDDFDLSTLHNAYPATQLVEKSNDSTSEIHKKYYRNIGSTGFNIVYRDFLRTVVVPEFKSEDLVVQRIPSFRIHRPGDRAVGEYHRDSDHGYNHQIGAVNFWVPLTDAYDTNTLHIIPDGSHQPQAYPVTYGDVLAFDAVNLLHGNEVNTTSHTRVSFDTRVIHAEHYTDSTEKSSNTNTPLNLSGYYSHLDDI